PNQLNLILPNDQGHTPLQMAIKTCNLQNIKWLLDNMTDPFLSHKDNDGYTVLHEAAEWLDLQALKLLVAKGGDALIMVQNKAGKTPLQVAEESTKLFPSKPQVIAYLRELETAASQ